MTYSVPESVAATVALLDRAGGTIVAGGTDFYPTRVGGPIAGDIVDISHLRELRGVTAVESGYRIGALTTWSDIAAAPLPPACDGLRRAAREIGSIQIQNVATIAGNLCNASPAADGVPPLLTLDAAVELTSTRGTRTLPIDEFIVGYRRTALGPDEMVTAVLIPGQFNDARSTFLKLGSRRHLVISIVMTATVIATDPAGTITAARVAVGACNPVAVRLRSLEADLTGRSVEDDLAVVVTGDHLAPLAPIDDGRATAAYRMQAAGELVRRSLAGTR